VPKLNHAGKGSKHPLTGIGKTASTKI